MHSLNPTFSAILVVILLSTAISSLVYANSAYALSTWAMRIGGGEWDDVFRGIEPASDGGYVIAGTTESFGAGGKDGWIIKLDENGNVESQRTFGGKGGDVIRSVKQTADGGFVTAGLSYSFGGGGGDVWMMKFDRNQNLQWQKTYGGSGFDMAHAVVPTSDGGYLLAGFTTSFGAVDKDYFVIKVDSSGDVQWQKRFGGIGKDVIRIAKQTSDGKYLVAGFTHSYSQKGDILVIKLDSEGNIEWQNLYGGGKFEEPCCILETTGGYIILEQSASFTGNTDGWVFKIDYDGDMLWQKSYGGRGFDELSGARMMPDGGFIAAGETTSFGSAEEDFWVVRFDSAGNIQWHKRYGGDGVDEAEAIALTPEGGSIIVGTTKSFGADNGDLWIVRLDSNGDATQCGVGAAAPDAIPAATISVTSSQAIETSITVFDTDVVTREGQPTVRPSTADMSFQCKGTQISPPEARDDSYAAHEDLVLNVPAPGVLGNDIDQNGGTLTALFVSGPVDGELALNADGSFTYVPGPNFNGIDSFSYRARNSVEYSDVSTVVINVIAVNDDPVATDDSSATEEGTPIKINLIANDVDVDGDTLAISSIGTSSIYGGTMVDNGDGSVTYTGSTGFAGADVFTYVVEDGNGGIDTATVTITVGAV